ncbi:hypothetical protein AUJ78_00740 [Candidatus Peregrinibacteria bacterium CG1_02_41_10]|nr:MAG: hypothetical protein AUJ78_00740 [Candidatus Peregrinibacteria bacterium CG1_02_41_10]PIZ59487.1 MAG: hypothetical protein COY18_03220 [Candidatus Saccharibacteria bacterium CG_4_10_14_0_2_um_filter_41_11]
MGKFHRTVPRFLNQAQRKRPTSDGKLENAEKTRKKIQTRIKQEGATKQLKNELEFNEKKMKRYGLKVK